MRLMQILGISNSRAANLPKQKNILMLLYSAANEALRMRLLFWTISLKQNWSEADLTVSTVTPQLEALGAPSNDAKRQQYNAWALQTRIRLYLREGRKTEARDLSLRAHSASDELPHARLIRNAGC